MLENLKNALKEMREVSEERDNKRHKMRRYKGGCYWYNELYNRVEFWFRAIDSEYSVPDGSIKTYDIHRAEKWARKIIKLENQDA